MKGEGEERPGRAGAGQGEREMKGEGEERPGRAGAGQGERERDEGRRRGKAGQGWGRTG